MQPGSVLRSPALLAVTFAWTALSWRLAARFWSRADVGFAASFFFLGLSLGPCLAGYLQAPQAHKQRLRKIVLAAGGLSILAPALLGGVEMDLEAFWKLAFLGTLAFGLGDARAFCKYLCPSGAILRWTSRPALVKIAPRGGSCDGCGSCSRACPMDIDVRTYARAGQRVASGDCSLCQRCAQACPGRVLRLTLRLDLGRGTHPVEVPPRSAAVDAAQTGRPTRRALADA